MLRVTDVFDDSEQRIDFGGGSVQLDDQNGFRAGKPWMHGCFGGFDRQPIHHLDGRRNDAGGDNFGDGRSGLLGRVERCKKGPHRFRNAQQPQRHLCDDRQRAFGSDQ